MRAASALQVSCATFCILLLLINSADATTIRVPADQPTIQAGIDAASPGDTVLVACGTYYDCTHVDPDGLPNCVIMKSGVCLRSETGLPDCVTIDAQGLGRVVYCVLVDNTATIEGFTLTGGHAEDPSRGRTNFGGAIYCYNNSSPMIRNCLVVGNYARSGGGGLFCSTYSSPSVEGTVFSLNSCSLRGGAMCLQESSLPSIVSCTVEGNEAPNGGGAYCAGFYGTFSSTTFTGNTADWGGALFLSESPIAVTDCLISENVAYNGGGVCCTDGVPTFSHVTFVGNSGVVGGALYCSGPGQPTLENTILAFSVSGEAVHCYNIVGPPTLTCCDVYGNVGGDWTDCIANQYGVNGNFSECPLFCDPENGDYDLQDCSPCVDGYGCGQVGAFGVGCVCGLPSASEQATWGRIKSQYRE